MSEKTFNGDGSELIAAARALLDLDASGSLAPHGIGGHAGKLWGHYAANANTKAFLDELSRSIGIPIDLLVQSVTKGKNEARGTWVHPHLAVNLATWLSPQFAVQVAKWVYEWMRGEYLVSHARVRSSVVLPFPKGG